MATLNYSGGSLSDWNKLQNVGIGTARGSDATNASWIKPVFGAEDPMALNDPYINKLLTDAQNKNKTGSGVKIYNLSDKDNNGSYKQPNNGNPNNTGNNTGGSLSAEDQATYDYTIGGLNRSLSDADINQSADLASLDSQANTLSTSVNKSKKTAEQQVADEIATAAKTSKDTQKSIRNILRALGVLGSTYAADQLNKPSTAFDENKQKLIQWGTDRVAELDDYLTQKNQEIESAKQNVIRQYDQIKSKIRDDIRYTDQQKFTALQAAKSAAQNTINQVSSQKAANEEKARSILANISTQMNTYLNSPGGFANLGNVVSSLESLKSLTSPTTKQVATQEKKYDIYGNLIQ